MNRPALLVAGALAGACGGSGPPLARVGEVAVEAGFAFAPVATEMAAYLSLRNRGVADDTLLAVTSPDAASVMVHRAESDGGRVTMTMLDRLPLPAGALTAMAPGGLHLMLTGLGRGLSPGDTVSLELRFGGGRTAAVRVPVRAYGDLP